MLYSTLLVAASAIAGASAQLLTNGTTYGTPIPCCSIGANQIDSERRDAICEAQTNTCSELCGGQGRTGTNNCDENTLQFQCTCTNSTSLMTQQLAPYEQTVPGQVCREWFNACINATGTDAQQQYQCRLARDQQCGNGTTRSTASSSSAGPSATGSSGSGGSSPSGTSSSGGASAAPSSGVAASMAMYGTPILAGGLAAVFGIAL